MSPYETVLGRKARVGLQKAITSRELLEIKRIRYLIAQNTLIILRNQQLLLRNVITAKKAIASNSFTLIEDS